MRKILVCPILFVLSTFFSSTISRADDCNALAKEPIRFVDLPGRPFRAISSADGCWVFASIGSSNPGEVNGIAVLRRAGNGNIRLQRVVPLESNVAGIALTHDGKNLLAADDEFVVLLDVAKMISGDGNPIIGFLRNQPEAGSVYVNVTKDDSYAFVSDEAASSITVIDLKAARLAGFNEKAIVGKIPVGQAPIALTFSSDEKFLFTTSEVAEKGWGWPAKCKFEGGDPANANATVPEGGVVVVDVEKAKTEPTHAVISRVPAGCSPVRSAISPDGSIVWVTIRSGDAVTAFDAAKLISAPEHAALSSVLVGRSPVGLLATPDGKYIVAANSNRFAGGESAPQSLSVIDAKSFREGTAVVAGTIEAGVFPRELSLTLDGKTILLTNYVSKSLEIIDVTHLPLKK